MSKKVYVYALSTCVHCKNTKKFLEEEGIDYDHVDVDQLTGDEREKVVNEIKEYNPKLSFPTLVVDGEKVIVGLKKDEIKEACGK